MEEYKGFTIEIIPGYCGGNPTVQYCGDDIIFESVEEAKRFIDEATSEKAETKEIKVEWCRNFIKKFFEKHCIPGGGVEVNCFWNAAEKSGLWVRGTYGSPMSKALCELTKVEDVHHSETGEYIYSVFKLK